MRASRGDLHLIFDAAHGVWLISSIPITAAGGVPPVFVNRSTDDGRSFALPVTIPPPALKTVDLDKNWTVCDNQANSPFRCHHCYTELDNFAGGDLELMSTSTDAGLTWSTPSRPPGMTRGLGGQPLVRPDGTVVIPFESLNGRIESFRAGACRLQVGYISSTDQG